MDFIAVYFLESLERRLKLEVILRQLENDSDRDVRASANATSSADESRMDETLDNNRTCYLDETIECEPSCGVVEVPPTGGAVVEAEEVTEDSQEGNKEETKAGGDEEEKEVEQWP